MRERIGGDLDPAELAQLLSPSLFGGRRVLVIRAAQDVKTAALGTLAPFLEQPADDTTLVLQHAGGARGKALLEAARRAGAREVACGRLTRLEDRLGFVRAEVRRAGGTIAPAAAAALLEAVGGDLRELAAVSAQLVSDAGGRVDMKIVADFHRGCAEVSGYTVSDRVVVGDLAGALEALRWALSIGVAPVVIADALADGVRSVARVADARRGNPYELAAQVGMPPWKVKRAQSQARGWDEPGLRHALAVVAELNAEVKGAAAAPEFALERAIGRIVASRTIG
ncbi:MAG: DNA polymerase III subunit delta [Actinomycetia bacterium]|nr:DNA polymerase III subunit delta [Actinomycetes bacterium]